MSDASGPFPCEAGQGWDRGKLLRIQGDPWQTKKLSVKFHAAIS